MALTLLYRGLEKNQVNGLKKKLFSDADSKV
jgi:hypothetical protein